MATFFISLYTIIFHWTCFTSYDRMSLESIHLFEPIFLFSWRISYTDIIRSKNKHELRPKADLSNGIPLFSNAAWNALHICERGFVCVFHFVHKLFLFHFCRRKYVNVCVYFVSFFKENNLRNLRNKIQGFFYHACVKFIFNLKCISTEIEKIPASWKVLKSSLKKDPLLLFIRNLRILYVTFSEFPLKFCFNA